MVLGNLDSYMQKNETGRKNELRNGLKTEIMTPEIITYLKSGQAIISLILAVATFFASSMS